MILITKTFEVLRWHSYWPFLDTTIEMLDHSSPSPICPQPSVDTLATSAWVVARSRERIPFLPNSQRSRPSLSTAKHQDHYNHDLLFSATLFSREAIPAVLGFHDSPDFDRVEAASRRDPSARGDMYLVRSASVVYSLGIGMQGYHGVLHGGMFSVLIDESVGSYLALNRDVSDRVAAGGYKDELGAVKDLSRLAGFWNGTTALTVAMVVRFIEAIPLPSIVLVSSSLVKIEGRKLVIESVVETEMGGKHATCESTWVLVQPGLKNSKL